MWLRKVCSTRGDGDLVVDGDGHLVVDHRQRREGFFGGDEQAVGLHRAGGGEQEGEARQSASHGMVLLGKRAERSLYNLDEAAGGWIA